MANINSWLENILLVNALFFSTWNREKGISIYLMSMICLAFSLTNWYASSRWINFSRKQSSAIMWYGSVVVSSIFALDSSSKELFGANVIFLVIFMISCNSIKSNYHLPAVIAFLGYFFLYGSYFNLMLNFLMYTLFVSKVLVFFSVFLFCFVTCSNSFSVGEALTASQLAIYFFVNAQATLFSVSFDAITLTSSIGYFTGILIMSTIIGISYNRTLQLYSTQYFYVMLGLISMLVILQNGLLTMISFSVTFLCQNYPTRQILVMLWLFLCLICCGYVAQTSVKTKATTIERKKFHVFILLVYLPGLAFDVPLLFLSSVALFCLFLIISSMCAFQIKPLGPRFVHAMLSFTDRQDSGKLILTPAYLVFGLSFPIWLCYVEDTSMLGGINQMLPLKCFAGVLSVGIGDASASLFGFKYGKTKIPGSAKSVEGTAASIIVQLLAILFLVVTKLVEVDCKAAIIATIVVSFVELVTAEVDNLVLPLVMYMLLS